jgi:murein DD-endopeptidase MepM/ murein hydrolase activator NlpD
MVSAAQGTPPSLLALSGVFGSGAPEDLTRQAGVVAAVVEAEAATLSQLEATRLVLEVESARHQAAVSALRVREQEARSVVEQRDRLVEEARVAKIGQAMALARLAALREDAARQRKQDLAQVAELERERSRIAEILRRRAARAEARSRGFAETGRQGSSTTGVLLRWPVVGYVSSEFGMRFHPVYKRWSLHDGLDIAAPCGTPVRAATDGVVVASYFNSAYGNRVILDNGLLQNVGVGTTYNHLSSFTVRAGERVSQGQLIGYVGTTGASTGCHLHFMVLENGDPVDPESWLGATGF